MSRAQEKRQYILNIKPYLKALSMLLQHEILQKDLVSLEDTEEIKVRSKQIREHSIKRFSIPYGSQKGHSFTQFLEDLFSKNKEGIYIWLKSTQWCGTIRAKNIISINFDIPFDIDKNGVLAFTTEDFRDRLTLDFYVENGRKVIEVETQGLNWSNVDVEYFRSKDQST